MDTDAIAASFYGSAKPSAAPAASHDPHAAAGAAMFPASSKPPGIQLQPPAVLKPLPEKSIEDIFYPKASAQAPAAAPKSPTVQPKAPAANATPAQQHDTWAAASRQRFGDKLDAELGLARRALDELGDDGLRQLLTRTALGSHPDVVAALARWTSVGGRLIEDLLLLKPPLREPRGHAGALIARARDYWVESRRFAKQAARGPHARAVTTGCVGTIVFAIDELLRARTEPAQPYSPVVHERMVRTVRSDL